MEIKVLSVKNPELTNVLPLKPGVGKNIAMHASPIATEFLPCLNFDLDPFTFTLSKFSPYFFTVLVLDNTMSHVRPRNKIGHPVHRLQNINRQRNMYFCALIDGWMVGFQRCNHELDKPVI